MAVITNQYDLFPARTKLPPSPQTVPQRKPSGQLLKWIGNKQRFARGIISHFPSEWGRYFEPFLGAGGVLGALAPSTGLASDIFPPLIDIWQTLKASPITLKAWYYERWQKYNSGDRKEEYEKIKSNYNARPNGADLLFLSRSCYGGVVRFRQRDGHMSTPCGIHMPITPASFNARVDAWHNKIMGTDFEIMDFRDSMRLAQNGDLIYCDPPYVHSQAILYGAQMFNFTELLDAISECKARGVYVALSIDGTKKSGSECCRLNLPDGLFEREVFLTCGRSMLKRFQMAGGSLENEEVTDRLLLTY